MKCAAKMKFMRMTMLAVVSLFFETSLVLAADWRTEPQVLSPLNLQRLKSRYTDIKTQSDLQMLLRDVGRMAPLAKLEAFYEEGIWVLRAKRTSLVSDIDFFTPTSLLRNELSNLAQQYIGVTDSDELRFKIQLDIRELFRKHGFPASSTSISAWPDEHNVKYRIRIDEGYPCIVSKVEVGFKLPLLINFGFKAGSFCDEKELLDAVETLELDLRAKGYKKLRLDKPNFIYEKKTNTAVAKISGDLGRRIRYEAFNKGESFSIFDFISSEKVEAMDPAIVGPDALGQELSKAYRAKGYDDVLVTGPKVTIEDGDIEVYRFEIDQGPQYMLSEVLFEGSSKFSKSELIEALGLSGFWNTSTPLNVEALREGLNRIRALYAKEGYWDTIIRDPRINKNRDLSTTQVVVSIVEGPRRVLGGLEIKDPVGFDHRSIYDALSTKEGQPVDRNSLVAIEQAAREVMLSSGYIYGAVDMEIQLERSQKEYLTRVILTLIPKTRVKIGDITIVGLIKTKNYVVERELVFNSGDWYDPNKIEESRVNLLNLGLFRSIQILPTNRDLISGEFDYLDVTIDLREAKPGNVSFGPGWSLAKGSRFTVESSYNNLFGTARQLYAKASLSEEAYQSAVGDRTLVGRNLTLGYLEPYVLNLPVNGAASLNHSAKADLFWTLTKGGELSLTHKFKRWIKNASISPFYGQKIVQEYGISEEKRALLSEDVRIAKMGLRFQYDKRNDNAWPTAGYVINSELSWAKHAFGGDIAFFFWEVLFSKYFRLSKHFVFAGGLNIAAFEGIDRKGSSSNDILPYSERLHAGGADTVRGFKERSLGPYALFDNDDLKDSTFGGSHLAVFKLELRYQIIPNQLGTAFFVDSGNSFFTQGELAKFEQIPGATIVDNAPYRLEELLLNPRTIWTKNYRSLGLALNYLTPLGSFNLAYGVPWSRCPAGDVCKVPRGNEPSKWYTHGEFHINVGAVF